MTRSIRRSQDYVLGRQPQLLDTLTQEVGSDDTGQWASAHRGANGVEPQLPICAAATALVLRRWKLAGRAVVTLVVGLGCACLVGGVMTFVLHHLQLGPTQLLPGQSAFLQGLSTVNISTPIVAFAAGVEGMLALESRASSAVGVAISVTTIPASAYLGVAAGVGDASKALGALAVLGVNIVMLLTAGSLTLIAQRALRRREARPLTTLTHRSQSTRAGLQPVCAVRPSRVRLTPAPLTCRCVVCDSA